VCLVVGVFPGLCPGSGAACVEPEFRWVWPESTWCEYTKPPHLTRLIRLNTRYLAIVPSVVTGLFGLIIFVSLTGPGFLRSQAWPWGLPAGRPSGARFYPVFLGPVTGMAFVLCCGPGDRRSGGIVYTAGVSVSRTFLTSTRLRPGGDAIGALLVCVGRGAIMPYRRPNCGHLLDLGGIGVRFFGRCSGGLAQRRLLGKN
jgi:hypothetical protein